MANTSPKCHPPNISLQSTSLWRQWPPLPFAREKSAAVAVGSSHLIVVGGFAQNKSLKDCLQLDLVTRQWQELPSMQQARGGCAAIYCPRTHQVVVVGGSSEGRNLQSVEVLNLTTRTWQSLPDMSAPRTDCAAVAVPEGIVVCGGKTKKIDAETVTDEVEVFDFKTKSWKSLTNMNCARAGCAAVAIATDNGSSRVMVLGGQYVTPKQKECLASVEILDLTTQRWSKCPPMKEKRESFGACRVGQCIMVMGGGETSTSPLASAEMFSLENKLWTTIPPMYSKRFGCTAVAVRNRVVVLGGRGDDGEPFDAIETFEIPMPGNLKDKEAAVSSTELVDKQKVPSTTLSKRKARNGPALKSSSPSVSTVRRKMEADKARVQEAYQRANEQTTEQYEQTVQKLEKRLQALEVERKELQSQKLDAKKQMDEHRAKAEKDRKEALCRIETSFRPLLARALKNPTVGARHNDDPQETHSSSDSSNPQERDQAQEKDQEPPSELCCSITGCIMVDPVTAMDGHTYERAAIEKWFRRFPALKSPTSPMTNEKLSSRRLVSSHNIRSQCETWLARVGADSVHAPDSISPPATSPKEGRRNPRLRSSSVDPGMRALHERSSTRSISHSPPRERAPSQTRNSRFRLRRDSAR